MGEHQEWSKFSNFEVATKVPFIVALPSANLFSDNKFSHMRKQGKSNLIKSNYFTESVRRSMKQEELRNISTTEKQLRKYDGLTELIDLFPTLVDLAGLPSLPKCSSNSISQNTCTEGISHSCVIKHLDRIIDANLNSTVLIDCPRKNAVLSQYPRPGPSSTIVPDSDQPRLTETTIMGYSLRERRYRYTRWCRFNSKKFLANCDDALSEELYDHYVDPGENCNLVSNSVNNTIKPRLRSLLMKYINS